MKNIKDYTNEVKTTVEEKLGGDYIITLQTKVAGPKLLNGMSVRANDSNIAPTVYLDDMFEKGMSIEDAADEVIKLTSEAQIHEDIDVSFYQRIDSVRNLLTIRLVSDEAAKMYVAQGIVVRPLLAGINKIYYVPVSVDIENGNGSIVVRKEHVSLWNISEDELDEIATNNINSNDNCKISSLFELIAKLTGMPKEMFAPGTPEDDNILVISNNTGMFGASELLNAAVMDDILDRVSAESVFVLPSSIHEFICVPNDGMADIDALREMVVAVNSSEVLPEDKLSDNVYIYSRDAGLAVA